MSREKNEPKPSDSLKFNEGFDALYSAAVILSATVTPLLRKRIGTRCYGWSGPIAFVVMFAYSGFAHCPLMLYWLAAWLVAVIYQRLNADRSRHSLDSGDPALVWSFFPGCGYGWAIAIESALCLTVGGVLYLLSEPFGLFLMAGACSLLFVHIVQEAALQARLRRIEDGAKENEWLQDHLKNSRR